MKIVVLAGGTSTERDVSLVSGKKIYTALKEAGHKCVLLDIFLGLEGVNPEEVFEKGDELLGNIEAIKTENPDIDKVKALRKDGGKVFFGPNVLEICQAADVVFMGLHGENGENGKVQATFDLLGIPYTGNDYLSSALAMDKKLSKELFKLHEVPTPDSYSLKKGEDDPKPYGFPVVVKVTDGGSSIGVSIVKDEAEYEAAKKDSFSYGNEILVEQYIKGREFSVGVILGKALPVIEIAPKTGFYDYKNKYQEGAAIETCPALLDKEQTERMQRYAEKVYSALRLNQYARVDFMMNDKGEMYCLEANTLPGMTPTSLMPQEAAVVGMSYVDLCEKLIRMALEK